MMIQKNLPQSANNKVTEGTYQKQVAQGIKRCQFDKNRSYIESVLATYGPEYVAVWGRIKSGKLAKELCYPPPPISYINFRRKYIDGALASEEEKGYE